MGAIGSAGPEVRVRAGRLRGRMEGGVAVFRGVPFGRPPVGALRLAAPVPAESWDGVREAVAFGAPPPQSRLLGASRADGGDGDWLTVNVWSPSLGGARLPVMVWIQGGGYMYGWSGDPLFDGRVLAGDGVVVVTFNYRVSAEGFGHFRGAPANRGLLDQVAALRWVRDNIAAFGGDPDRVTVFGESAGAGSIAALMTMPSAAGLFRRAIALSVPGLFFSAEVAADIAAAVAAELGLPPDAGELRSLPPERLIDAGDAVADKSGGCPQWGRAAYVQTPFAPVVDGEVLPDVPWRSVPDGPAPGAADGTASGVDLIVGHNRDEYRLFMLIKGDLGQITAERADAALRQLAPDPAGYRAAFPDACEERLFELVHSDWLFRMPSLRLAEAHQRRGGSTRLFELTWPAPGMGGDVLGACHGLGLPLTFGNLTEGVAALLLGQEPPPAAAELSARVRAAWTAFAATGDPGWPAYEQEGRLTWVVGAEPAVAAYPEETSRALWAGYGFDPLPLGPR
ncbi:carboxylesterase [[Actinomadura] parvosata subsp. kistnae]|uniref:Carboxylic ester hydrolase n=1 Tax=[Actinomadura] parvosata subsp. kistnae TaxID=1909395 RepID=A0A1V0AJA6_9ACTN|nr:carboxylesterase family protein [Nonomuraea sp. ATCC 55076]AQZ70286.1 carboxylesterase [Nonomuraea sp. ATCC 55076]